MRGGDPPGGGAESVSAAAYGNPGSPDRIFRRRPGPDRTEILDETRPGWDLEELSRIYQGTLIGAYVDHFRGKNAPVEQKALFYGVEALMEARRDL